MRRILSSFGKRLTWRTLIRSHAFWAKCRHLFPSVGRCAVGSRVCRRKKEWIGRRTLTPDRFDPPSLRFRKTAGVGDAALPSECTLRKVGPARRARPLHNEKSLCRYSASKAPGPDRPHAYGALSAEERVYRTTNINAHPRLIVFWSFPGERLASATQPYPRKMSTLGKVGSARRARPLHDEKSLSGYSVSKAPEPDRPHAYGALSAEERVYRTANINAHPLLIVFWSFLGERLASATQPYPRKNRTLRKVGPARRARPLRQWSLVRQIHRCPRSSLEPDCLHASRSAAA
jgi:hypothetical protein